MLRLRDSGRMLGIVCGLLLLSQLGASEASSAAALGFPLAGDTAEGYAAFFNGDLETAAKRFRAAAENDRNDHLALAAQAALAAGDCDYQRALELYCKAFAAARQSAWG